MHDLDDLEVLQVDRSGMLELLLDLPAQLQTGERLGQSADLPSATDVRAIVVTGLGGSSISGDLLRAYVHAACPVPIVVNRHYSLPGFVGPETLVCAISYSGNTEETLSAFEAAQARGAKLLAVTSGGQLAQMAERAHVPCVRVQGGMPPRTTLGYLFTPMLVMREGASSVGTSRFLAQPETAMPAAITVARVTVRRDIILSRGMAD